MGALSLLLGERASSAVVRTGADRATVEAVFDVTGRLPGRGAYVCSDPECRRTAVSRGALARALRTQPTPELEAELGLATMTRTPTEGGSRGQE